MWLCLEICRRYIVLGYRDFAMAGEGCVSVCCESVLSQRVFEGC